MHAAVYTRMSRAHAHARTQHTQAAHTHAQHTHTVRGIAHGATEVVSRCHEVDVGGDEALADVI